MKYMLPDPPTIHISPYFTHIFIFVGQVHKNKGLKYQSSSTAGFTATPLSPARLASDDNGCVATRRFACPLDKCYPGGRRQLRISWTHKCCMQFSDRFTESQSVSKQFFSMGLSFHKWVNKNGSWLSSGNQTWLEIPQMTFPFGSCKEVLGFPSHD